MTSRVALALATISAVLALGAAPAAAFEGGVAPEDACIYVLGHTVICRN